MPVIVETIRSSVGEFAGCHEHVDEGAVAPHRHLDPACDRIFDHQLLNRRGGDDISAVDTDHDVAAARATGMCAPAMPSHARRTRPVFINAAMILWVDALIGTAKPRPTPATAVLTPTIRPRPSASTPPLFPGFSAASVCITSSTTRPARVGSERPRPEMMPAVTLPARPSGLPTATTSCPTCRSSA